MAGIIFFKTTNLKRLAEFYQGYLGLKLWLDQGGCHIYEMGNMKLGFCQRESTETQGVITFYYPQKDTIDALYEKYREIATSEPRLNPDYNIYHFWAKDPDGRALEFQYFMPPAEASGSPLELLNPESDKALLLLTMLLPDKAMQELKQNFRVLANTRDRLLKREELLAGVKDAEALLCLLGDRIDAELMDAAPKLKVISNYAVGYNNIDLDAAKARGIAVCNTPGVLSESTADLAWALIMNTARRILPAERFTREGQFEGWKPLLFLGKDVYRAKLGIIGMGRIGQAVARRAIGFGMKVIYTANSEKELDFPAKRVELNELLQEADIVSLHLPLTEKTRYLLDTAELDLMKPGAILINTARGPVVNEAELIKRLQDGRIYAAGFDVYEYEPHIPQELMELDNVVLLPHIGSASIETRTEMGLLAAANASAIIKGEKAPARVV